MMSRLLPVLVLSASLSGCLSILPDPTPAPSVYRLTTQAQPVDKSATAELIRIDRPTATHVFNSSNIVVTKKGQKVSTIAKAKWSQATPDLIQESLISALEGSSQFVGLVSISGAQTETKLHLYVKNFEADFDNGSDNAPLAIVEYRVTYAQGADRKLLGTYTIRKTRRASSINVSSIVSAIEQANDAAMSDIVTWLETKKSNGLT